MESGDRDRAALREKGLRVTPQRRAILGVFHGAANEHLSAEDVHSRASALLPELGRGTVYSTLAELTEIGLLVSVGSSEPVRYALEKPPHHHFRCLVCRRWHDVDLALPDLEPLVSAGYVITGAGVTAEGTCSECVRYEEGLEEGVARIQRSPQPFVRKLEDELGCALREAPVGTLALAATERGLVRLAFPEHADFEYLSAMADRKASVAARRQLAIAAASLDRYWEGTEQNFEAPVDWESVTGIDVATLQATNEIPYGQVRSYTEISDGHATSPRDMGAALGSNPVPIFLPCHRVSRGLQIPPVFVGGAERRSFLLEHEHSNSQT
jgi:methylated-DNA-[protein]-cysteine S-methyltransferase